MEMDGIGRVWTENIRPKTLLEFARFYPLYRTFFNATSTIFRPTCFDTPPHPSSVYYVFCF